MTEAIPPTSTDKPFEGPMMSLRDFIDGGYLAEINRRVLHPVGLALAIDITTGRIDVWDGRDDPEGWRFGNDPSSPVYLSIVAKSLRVVAEFIGREPARREALGYMVQPCLAADGELLRMMIDDRAADNERRAKEHE